MTPQVAKLTEIVRAWGGNIVQISPEQMGLQEEAPGFSGAPFTRQLGIDWSRKIVYHVDAHWADLIHEIGHVFATLADPDACQEFDFLGWEFVLAKKIGGSLATWIKKNAEYVVGLENIAVTPLRQLKPSDRAYLFRERVATARMNGIVVGWEPVAVR